MSIYLYKGQTEDGKMVSGQETADNRAQAIQSLRQKNIYCYSIKKKIDDQVSNNTKLKFKEVASFCKQLSAMLTAGVTMTHALEIIYNCATKKRVKAIMLQTYQNVHSGLTLSAAMSQMGEVFPEILIHMTETGEASGTLDRVMAKMAQHFEREVQIKNKIQVAMIYPTMLLFACIACVLFLVTYVLPQFVTMFEGVDLPIATTILLAVSNFIKAHWIGIILAILGVLVIWISLMKQRKFKAQVHSLIIKIPIIGKLIRTIHTSRFSATLSVLYSSGISLLTSIDIISKVIGNIYIEQKLQEVAQSLKKGDMLSESIDRIKVFDPIFTSMILVGEESGSLTDILDSTGEFFQKEANAAIEKMLALIEPVMIVIFGFIIGFIVISIILPIFKMYSQII